MTSRTMIWDWPVRLFHWSLAASFAGAWLTADSERWLNVHIACGYTMAGLIVFRLLWGIVGTRHARFSDFIRGPKAVIRYLRSLLSAHPEPHAGHNPLGAIAVVMLLTLGLATAASGWAMYNELGGEWLEEVHEILATVMLVVVGMHVVGVIFSSLKHHENLIASMFTGYKPGHDGQGITHTRPLVAILMIVSLGSFWAWTLNNPAPAGVDSAASDYPGEKPGETDNDDD